MGERGSYRIKMVSVMSDVDLIRYQKILRNRLNKTALNNGRSDSMNSMSRSLRESSTNLAPQPEPDPNLEPEPVLEPIAESLPTQKISLEGSQIIYLYLQLQNIVNMPEDDNKRFYINLRHSMTNYVEGKEIKRNKKISFAIPIEQNNSDVANSFSDEPVIISLMQILPPNENNEENNILLAEGQIDLIQFFTKKRSIINTEILLYPASMEQVMDVGTCKSIWHVYSLQPLIKSADFNNMIFITLESIYNANSDIQNLSDDLGVSLSFRSKAPKKNNEPEVNKICSFERFKKGIIYEQETKYTWASVAKHGANNLGKATDCSLSIHRIFSDLLCTENVNFGFGSISVHEDEALICNLMRRYILNEESTNILQEIIAFDEQELIIEVYQYSKSDIILLRGVIDLSIFLYPNVNSCRYAVELKHVDRATTSKRSAQNTINSSHKNGKVTFATLNICILQPITESQLPPYKFGEQMQEEAMKTCLPNRFLTKSVSKKGNEICEENYKSFDLQITCLIDYIIRKEIQSIEDAKEFLCCQTKNLTQKILKLISCDFNVRIPTKNFIEFSNLMTLVYKELEKRCSEILQNCEKNKSLFYRGDQVKKILLYMSTIKVLNEADAKDIANIYQQKLKELETDEFHVEGYTFLYNMEMQNFDEAKKHFRKPKYQKFTFGDYYDSLFEIYISYMEISQSKTTYNQALEYLLSSLENYANRFQRQPSIWILLYCIYNTCGYLPGMSFTRWKYENLHPEFKSKLPELPLPLWDIYCKCDLEFVTKKSFMFYEAVTEFLKLGLYRFAQIIFKAILKECTEAETYFINVTLEILLKKLSVTYPVRFFEGLQTKVFQSHVNGNLDYYFGNVATAIDCYAAISKNAQIIKDVQIYQISIMRYAKYLFEHGDYEEAIRAYGHCFSVDSCNLVAHFGAGKAFYRLGNFDKAELQLSRCTSFGIHIPDVWGYLALTNLRLRNTVKALESWKYAKLNPDRDISEEIYDELNKINLNEIKLFFDN